MLHTQNSPRPPAKKHSSPQVKQEGSAFKDKRHSIEVSPVKPFPEDSFGFKPLVEPEKNKGSEKSFDGRRQTIATTSTPLTKSESSSKAKRLR